MEVIIVIICNRNNDNDKISECIIAIALWHFVRISIIEALLSYPTFSYGILQIVTYVIASIILSRIEISVDFYDV